MGNKDGSIRFYDFQFKIVAWFEDINLAQITSISFSKRNPRLAISHEVDERRLENKDDKDQGLKIEKVPFECSDFIAADTSGMVVELNSQIFEAIEPQKKKGTTLFAGLRSSIAAIAVSPVDTILAIAGKEGYIILWNYIKKGDPIAHNYANYSGGNRGSGKDAKKKDGNKARYTCITFTPDGSELIVCDAAGEIKVMDMKTSQFKESSAGIKVSEKQGNYCIQQVEMCNDGPYFATADVSRGVSLFKKDYVLSQG